MTTNRSSEELAMRDLIVPELRKRWPSARIVHEFPLRYSTNRIDLAAITKDEIISVEIKSSRDVADRLEAQVRAFLPISSQVIVALAPKWNEQLENEKREVKAGKGYPAYTAYIQQRTEAQAILHRIGDPSIETWTVDVEASAIEVTSSGYHRQRPWLARMLYILHVSELTEIAAQHRCWHGKRPVHLNLVDACTELMTGREIVAAVCGALRARDAFVEGSDPPIREVVAP